MSALDRAARALAQGDEVWLLEDAEGEDDPRLLVGPEGKVREQLLCEIGWDTWPPLWTLSPVAPARAQ